MPLTAIISTLTGLALSLIVARILIQRLIDRDSARERRGRVVNHVVHAGISDVFEVAVRYA